MKESRLLRPPPRHDAHKHHQTRDWRDGHPACVMRKDICCPLPATPLDEREPSISISLPPTRGIVTLAPRTRDIQGRVSSRESPGVLDADVNTNCIYMPTERLLFRNATKNLLVDVSLRRRTQLFSPCNLVYLIKYSWFLTDYIKFLFTSKLLF